MSRLLPSSRLLPRGLRVLYLRAEWAKLTMLVEPEAICARCPLCDCLAKRIHSRYTRTISDLPWRGIAVSLKVRARKFFCGRKECERNIFCERLPEVAAYARKTSRLEEVLLLVAFEMGGEAGARLARELGLLVSPDSLLERVRKAPRPPTDGVQVLGIDDFAFKRAHRYGTILVDLERRKVIDLLPDRSAEALEVWLKKHPQVKVIARDRYQPYADGARRGSPHAVQVADRWHLLKNLSDALEKVLERNASLLPRMSLPDATRKKVEEDAYVPRLCKPVANYIRWCWRKGQRDIEEIWRDVSRSVPSACREDFEEFVERLRAGLTEPFPDQKREQSAFRNLSPAEVAQLLVRDAQRLSSSKREYLKKVGEVCPEVAEAYDLARTFASMLPRRTPEMLDGWLEEASKSKLSELKSFAGSIRRDEAAVRAGLALPWSSGQVEGQIHRLKLIKRQGYGRAGFDLLKRRVLGAA